jgi:hypothetical protein
MILVHVPFLWVHGMALFPFVLIRHKRYADDERLINHERIHLRQQLEMMVLPFYVWYLAEYAWHRLHGRTHRQAYLRISFEREAYARDQDLDYLLYRPWWNFRRYFFD